MILEGIIALIIISIGILDIKTYSKEKGIAEILAAIVWLIILFARYFYI